MYRFSSICIFDSKVILRLSNARVNPWVLWSIPSCDAVDVQSGNDHCKCVAIISGNTAVKELFLRRTSGKYGGSSGRYGGVYPDWYDYFCEDISLGSELEERSKEYERGHLQ